jgi:uncharacterized protein with NRDE domain
MCLLLFQYGGDKFPFVLCSNRDEALFRETSRGSVRTGPLDSTRYYAPIDQEAGGTWIAFSEINSRFAVVLNYHEWRTPQSIWNQISSLATDHKSRKSRGHLPLDFITASKDVSAESYASEIAARCCGLYSGFNFIVGDVQGCYYVSNQACGSQPLYLEPGVVHGISNGSIDDTWCKVKISKTKISRILQDCGDSAGDNCVISKAHVEELTLQLMQVMQDNTLLVDPTLGYIIERYTRVSAIFVDPIYSSPGKISPVSDNYGTRTTTIAVLGRDGVKDLCITERDLDAKSSTWSLNQHFISFSPAEV